MKKLKKVTVFLLASVVAILIAASMPVGHAQATESNAPLKATDLGGLNLNGYCHQKYYISTWSTKRDGYAYLSYNSPYGWKCSVRTYYLDQTWSESLGMDLNEACRMQKGSGAYAGLTGNKDPYSWHCFR